MASRNENDRHSSSKTQPRHILNYFYIDIFVKYKDRQEKNQTGFNQLEWPGIQNPDGEYWEEDGPVLALEMAR